MTQQNAPWTTRRLLGWTTQHFEKHRLDSPRLSAEMLLSHVLEVSRIKLYMDQDRPASELERAAFRSLVERAIAHEPVDYLVGHTLFYSLMLKVSPAVLIPRPSTETIIDHVLQHSRSTPGLNSPIIADIGTGSGAIAITLAKNLPESHIIATDVSEDALAIAKTNATEHGVADRIEFRCGSLLEPFGEAQKLHYLISNPPYISDKEFEAVEPNVKNYEPHLALRGGEDGLDLLRVLIDQAQAYLETDGQLILEFAASQDQAMQKLAKKAGFDPVNILADHEGFPRVLVAGG